MPRVTVSRKIRDPEQAFWFPSCAPQGLTLLLPRPRKGSIEKAQGLKGRGACVHVERGKMGWGSEEEVVLPDCGELGYSMRPPHNALSELLFWFPQFVIKYVVLVCCPH